MTSANKALVILVVASLGLWGCAKGPANGSGGQEKIKALEARISKLEEDFQAAAAARDQFRQRLTAVEAQRTQLQKDRDDLQQQLTTRTTERDTAQTQYEQFRKNIRNLLGQAEATVNATPQPPVAATTTSAPSKS